MLRRIGMSVFLALVCLNAYAQLPHPKDTLENGKKVPFNQFLGRFSVFNDFYGTTFPFSLNVSYSILKSDLVSTDLSVGFTLKHRRNSADFQPLIRYVEHDLPISIILYLGRRASRLNMRTGYMMKIYPYWFSGKEQAYPSCGQYCPTPPQHFYFFSLGYTYQNPYGFFFSLNAYGLYRFPLEKANRKIPLAERLFPMAGLSVGYRLPSKQLHREWRERGFKKRVLRLEEPKEKRKTDDEIDDIFYNDQPLEVDSTEMLEIEAQLAKLKKRHDRYLKEEARLNGRSLVFAEFFGASGISSLNYSYTHPIARSNIFMMEYRGGLGTDQQHLQLPVHVGIKAMKNYRGTGVFLGIEPQYNWNNGTFGAVYFLEHNVEFHFAYGLTGGVAFYLFYDPMYYKNHWNFSPYGGFFLGYRLPQIKKD